MNKPAPKTIAFAIRLVLGLVLLAGAGRLVGFLVATKPKVSTSDLAAQAIRVQVMRVEPIDVARQWRGYGTTQAKDTVDVPARVGATVVELPADIEVGRVVRARQTLVRLDATDFRNTFNAAEKRIAESDALVAQLDIDKKRLEERLVLIEQDAALVRTDYQRQVDRLESGSATPTDIDRAKRKLLTAERAVLAIKQQLDAIPPRLAGLEAQKAVATADRDTAQTNLDRTVITSPIDGIIESLDIELGENLAPGARVARIIDPRIVEVPLQLPASARSYITVGNAVTLQTRSQPDDCPPWSATVTRIGVVNGPTRTFTVFAEVDQSKQVALRNFAQGGGPYKLPAGAFTLARLDTDEPSPRMILPARAIQQGRIRTIVEGEVVSKNVDVAFDLEGLFPQFGVPDDQWVVLKEPLEAGELVVLSASMTILDGQSVVPVITNDQPAEQIGEDHTTARNGGEPAPADGDTP